MGEVAPLLEARLKVLALLLSFVLGKNLVRIQVTLRFSISVRNANINDAVCATGPKAIYYKDISMVIVGKWIDASDWIRLFLRHCNGLATWVDSGFVANSQWY
jgi:hypothetical protein